MTEENKKRPFITIKEAIVASLVIMAVSITFEKPFSLMDILTAPPQRHVDFAEASLFASKIEDITTRQIAEKFEIKDGKPSMVIFHASWCMYCRKLLANIVALKNEGKMDGVHLLVVSVDESRVKLATYLLQRNYDRIFPAYIIKPDKTLKIKDIVANKGGHYTGVIPYSLFFDGDGKLVKEQTGRMSREEILKAIGQ